MKIAALVLAAVTLAGPGLAQGHDTRTINGVTVWSPKASPKPPAPVVVPAPVVRATTVIVVERPSESQTVIGVPIYGPVPAWPVRPRPAHPPLRRIHQRFAQ